MEIGEVKPSQLFVAGFVILFLVFLGFLVSKKSPTSSVSSPEISQPTTPPPAPAQKETIISQKVDTIFEPLGKTSIAVKLPANHSIEFIPGEQPDDGFYANVLPDSSSGIVIISSQTLAGAIKEEKSCNEGPCQTPWSEKEFLDLHLGYQQGNEVEGHTIYNYKDRLYYYKRVKAVGDQGEFEYFRTFFGDNYLVEVRFYDSNEDLNIPSELASKFMEEAQFTSKFFSRHGLKQVFKRLFSEKNLVSMQAIEISTLWATETHARGELAITTTEGIESGIFFAVKKDNKWMAIFDGNGSYPCSLLNFNGFPENMHEGCN